MKKLGLCLMLCFLFLGNLAAQWSVGGKVGVDWSKMTYPIDGMDTHFKAGATLGAVANYQLNDWLDLQGELLYSQHNYKDDLVVDGIAQGEMISMFPTKYSYYKLIHINIHRFQSIFITFFSDVWSLIPYNRKDSQN